MKGKFYSDWMEVTSAIPKRKNNQNMRMFKRVNSTEFYCQAFHSENSSHFYNVIF